MADAVRENRQEIPNAHPELIRLIVKYEDRVMIYKVNKSAPLGIVKTTSCRIFKVKIQDVNFRYKGMKIKNLDTSESMGMMNGDFIHVLKNSNPIMVTLKYGNRMIIRFLLNKYTPIFRLRKAFCQYLRIPMRAISLRLAGNTVKDTDTPATLGIDEGGSLQFYNALQLQPLHNETNPIVITMKYENQIILSFIIHKNSPLIKLMKACCHKQRVPMRAVCFRFNGTTIEETDTAQSLGIVDGDSIDLYNAQEGPLNVSPHELATNRIIIKVLKWDNHSLCNFYTQRTTPVINVLQRLCRRSGVSSRDKRFSYEGVMIQESDTPASLGMEEGDTLDIFYAQEGGGSF